MPSHRARRLQHAASVACPWHEFPRIREAINDLVLDLGDSEASLSLAELSATALHAMLDAYGPIPAAVKKGVEIVAGLLHMELQNRYPDAKVPKLFADLKATLSANPIDWSNVQTLYEDFLK